MPLSGQAWGLVVTAVSRLMMRASGALACGSGTAHGEEWTRVCECVSVVDATDAQVAARLLLLHRWRGRPARQATRS